LAVIAGLAILGPWISPEDPNKIDVIHRFMAPGPGQWLGRDELGRDVLSRVLAGAAVSMGVGLAAALLTTLAGAVLGALAGYKGGWMDAVLMRTADVLMCIPTLYLVLTLIVILGPGLQNVILVIVATGWTSMARLVRAEVMTLRERDFVMAARASGARSWSVLWKHVLPNAMAPVYVAGAEDDDEGQHQVERGDAHQHVGGAHEDGVHPTAFVAGQGAQHGSGQRRQQGRSQAHAHRDGGSR
jgi:peptide/nickel transport system permease protein